MQRGGGLGHAERAVRASVAGHQVTHGIGHRFQERQRHTHGQRNPQGVAHAGGIFHRTVNLRAAHAHDDRAVGADQLIQQGLGVGLAQVHVVGLR